MRLRQPNESAFKEVEWVFPQVVGRWRAQTEKRAPKTIWCALGQDKSADFPVKTHSGGNVSNLSSKQFIGIWYMHSSYNLHVLE